MILVTALRHVPQRDQLRRTYLRAERELADELDGASDTFVEPRGRELLEKG
jgi:hypothetical protein